MADKVVYIYMVGDLFHVGHLNALRQAKALGDYLIVGVMTDEAVMAYKRKPIIPFTERRELIKTTEYVDEVITQNELDPTNALKQLGARGKDVDIIVHGDDWGEDFPGAEYMRSIGKEAMRIRYYPYQSTTKIIGEIKRRIEL